MKETKKKHRAEITKDTQSRKQHRQKKKSAAKIRRELSEKWQYIEQTPRYLRARTRAALINTTQRIAKENIDGVFIRLNDHNNDRPYQVKKRLLRRIVEKRQAQALMHSGVDSRVIAVAINVNTSRCMAHLDRLRHAC